MKKSALFSKLLDLTSNSEDLPATPEGYKAKKEGREVVVIAVLAGGVMRPYAT